MGEPNGPRINGHAAILLTVEEAVMGKWFTAMGGLLLLAGFVIGFSPVSAGGYDCGSPLGGENDDAAVAELTSLLQGIPSDAAAPCEASMSERTMVMRVLVWTGFVSAAGGGLVWALKDSKRHETTPA